MKFTKLDLSTKLKAIATKQRSVFDAANDQPKIKEKTRKLLEAEIKRQGHIYLKEEKAYCEHITEIRKDSESITGEALDLMKDLQKLKNKPKNAGEIKAMIDRINFSARVVSDGKKEMDNLALGLKNHQGFRGKNTISGYKDAEAVIGAPVCKILDQYFFKLQAAAVQWVGLVKADRVKIIEHDKRMQMAVNMAKAAKGDAATARTAMKACDRQLDQLDHANGDLYGFFNGQGVGLASRFEDAHDRIMSVVKGKDKNAVKNIKTYTVNQRKLVSGARSQLKEAHTIAKTASLRYTNIKKLGNKLSLPPASKTRLSAAKAKINEMDKLNKKAIASLDKYAKSVAKLEKMAAK